MKLRALFYTNHNSGIISALNFSKHYSLSNSCILNPYPK
jgi:hypothetical protein